MRLVDTTDSGRGPDYLCVNGDIMNDKLHALYGKIKDMKDRIESLTYKLTELKKPESDCEAKLSLIINRNVRSTSYYYLNKSQVLMILKAEISEHSLELALLDREYKALL